MRLACASSFVGLGLFLAVSGGAGADETTPCPDSEPRPELSIVEPGGAGSLYATHILRASVDSPDGIGVEVRSVDAPGARVLAEEDGRYPLVSEQPGPLTATAVVVLRDPDRLPSSDDYSCTTTIAATVSLLAPKPSVFGDFARPRYLVPKRKLYSPHPVFTFTVKPAKVGADKSPFTVRARTSHRLAVPGRGARAVVGTYPQRDFEFPDEEPRARRGCDLAELVCPPVTGRGFAKGVEVRVDRLGSAQRGGLKVTVAGPNGLHFFAGGRERFKPTPWGADVQVLQSGKLLGRLRVAARCDSFGQSSECRFKRVDPRLR